MSQGYGHISLDCPNLKSIIMINREIHDIFEEEKEDIPESFEEEIMGEPIYDEEYVGADICELFKENGKRDQIYDDEYVPHDIHEVFVKDEHDEPNMVNLWRLKEACKQQIKKNHVQNTISSTLPTP